MNEVDRLRLTEWLDGTQSLCEGSGDAPDEESCGQIADSLLVHGLLTDLSLRDENRESGRVQALMLAIESEAQVKPAVMDRARVLNGMTSTRVLSRPRRWMSIATLLTIAAAVILMVSMVVPHQNASAAMTSLQKVLEAISLPLDRTYEIHVVEEYPPDKLPRDLQQENRVRKSTEQIDGGKLYVRGTDQFVFVRQLSSGGQRVSGCDGVQSWAFYEEGPVHVSSDPSRFRGGIPGEKQDMPFINIHSHLEQLQTSYVVELYSDREADSNGMLLSRLVGIRKSQEVRGPKLVEIWFDPENGTIHRFFLDGLPRGGGGPKSASLELVSQSDLGSDFFLHESHHEPERLVRYEEPRK